MIDLGREVARFDEQELSREVSEEELTEVRRELDSLRERVKLPESEAALIEGLLARFSSQLEDIEKERVARSEERAREKAEQEEEKEE